MALLPLALTIAVIGWIAGIITQFVGPQSLFGKAVTALGLQFTDDSRRWLAYAIGTLFVLIGIFFFGVVVRQRLRLPVQRMAADLVRRIPLVGQIYDLANRIVDMFNRKEDPALNSMTPVWVFFGGPGRTAVLALMPVPDVIQIEGHGYHGVLVPTAPVPVGGGLLFVPVEWVKPAPFGADGLTSIYVSMGVTVPAVLAKAKLNLTPSQATVIQPES
jgi:uncharacterized membrane protein